MDYALQVLAAAADDFGLAGIMNLGAVGAIAAIGIMFAKGAHADVKEQRDKAQRERDAALAENVRLNDLLREAHLTALRESSTALVRATDVLKEVVDDERGRRR